MTRKIKKPSPPQYVAGAAEALRRLTLLRENADYREFFGQYRDRILEARKRLAAAFAKKDYQEISEAIGPLPEFHKHLRNRFGIYPSSYLLDNYFHIFDPNRKIGAVEDPGFEWALKRMFWEPPITQVRPLKGQSDIGSICRVPLEFLQGRGIKLYERVILLDLRADKTTLIEAFQAFMNNIEKTKAYDPEQFAPWWPDQTREKKRYNRDVDIWRLHREGMSSAEVGRRLNIPVRTVLDAFHTKYEEVEGKPFNRGTFRRKYLKRNRKHTS